MNTFARIQFEILQRVYSTVVKNKEYMGRYEICTLESAAMRFKKHKHFFNAKFDTKTYVARFDFSYFQA